MKGPGRESAAAEEEIPRTAMALYGVMKNPSPDAIAKLYRLTANALVHSEQQARGQKEQGCKRRWEVGNRHHVIRSPVFAGSCGPALLPSVSGRLFLDRVTSVGVPVPRRQSGRSAGACKPRLFPVSPKSAPRSCKALITCLRTRLSHVT
jgi:hypothetical protein